MFNPDLPLQRSPNHVQMIEGYVERSEFNPTTQTNLKQTFPRAIVTVKFLRPDGVYENATIYRRDGRPADNPFPSNSAAYYSFYAGPGTYDVIFTDPTNPDPNTNEITRLKDVKVESLVYNVRDYGARGEAGAEDPTRDDAVAIRDAIQAMKDANGGANANGIGTLFIPNGIYIIRTPIDLPSGIVIQGTNAQYAGNAGSSCLLILTEPNTSMFTIGTNRQRIAIRDLGMTTLGSAIALPGTKAIECAEEKPGFTVTGLEFDNLSIWGFDRGISVEGHPNDPSEWDVTNVRVNRCAILECNYSIYLNSQNCDFWKIVDSRIGTTVSGYGIYLAKVGIITIDSVVGIGGNSPERHDLPPAFIYLTPVRATVTIINSECEGFLNSIEVAANVKGNIGFPIVVLNCTFGDAIRLAHNCDYVSIGNRYYPGTVTCAGNGNDVRIFSFGDVFTVEGGLPQDNSQHDFGLLGTSRIVSRANRFRVDFGNPARFADRVGVGSRDLPLSNTALSIAPLKGGEAQLSLNAHGTGEQLFKISADANFIYFDNPRNNKRLMKLDGDGNLIVKGLVTPNGNP